MMVHITLCIACQYGFHDRHQEVIEAVPEGVMGGAMCPCTGDCTAKPLVCIEVPPDPERDAAVHETMEFLRRSSEANAE